MGFIIFILVGSSLGFKLDCASNFTKVTDSTETTTFYPFEEDIDSYNDTTDTTIFYDLEDFSTTLIPVEDEVTVTTEEPEILYLEFDHEFVSREKYWSANRFECIEGKLVPSPYLRRKYYECERIHRHHPQCTGNCQQAITMLLGTKQTPEYRLYKSYFEIALPLSIQRVAISHILKCFDNHGKNEDDFLDPDCEGPQPFLNCTQKLKNKLICNDSGEAIDHVPVTLLQSQTTISTISGYFNRFDYNETN